MIDSDLNDDDQQDHCLKNAAEPNVAPRLLVSVRDTTEAAIAIAAGVTLVDFKEPRDGALAPVDPGIWRQAVTIKPPAGVEYSAALGESQPGKLLAEHVPAEFTFAKIGPVGIRSLAELQQVWRTTADALPDSVELVAVAYADHVQAQTPPPLEIFARAAAIGIRRCLIDTYTKDGRSTRDHLGIEGLRQIDQLAEQRDLWMAFGGGLGQDDVRRMVVEGIHPDCIAVRGAVCSGDRTGELCGEKIRHWSVSSSAGPQG